MKMTLPYRAALSDTARWESSSRERTDSDERATAHGSCARRSGGPGVIASAPRRRRLLHIWRSDGGPGGRTAFRP